jgi:hypothetical protein
MTTDFSTAPLADVVKSILADGIIDDAEINALKNRLYADGKIDTEEAEALFQINDAAKGKSNSAEWNKFFADAISDYLLRDEKSPGIIDDDEAKWLIAKIERDGEIDDNEKFLLKTIKEKATSLPPTLREKLKTWGL